jgi:hypothetical protein
MTIPEQLLDILHRLIHSSAAQELEKNALHNAVDALGKVNTPVKEEKKSA